MHFIDTKGRTEKQQECFNNHRSLNHATNYLWPWGWTHTHTWPHESDFKKPGARSHCTPGLKINKMERLYC